MSTTLAPGLYLIPARRSCAFKIDAVEENPREPFVTVYATRYDIDQNRKPLTTGRHPLFSVRVYPVSKDVFREHNSTNPSESYPYKPEYWRLYTPPEGVQQSLF